MENLELSAQASDQIHLTITDIARKKGIKIEHLAETILAAWIGKGGCDNEWPSALKGIVQSISCH